MSKVYNFNAGPAILPQPVLEQAQQELRDYQGRGMSILEMSHRSKEYEAINTEAEAAFKRLLGLGDEYRVLFLQGGASMQFAMLPLNFLPPGATADYLVNGAWGEKAYEEGAKLGQALGLSIGVESWPARLHKPFLNLAHEALRTAWPCKPK